MAFVDRIAEVASLREGGGDAATPKGSALFPLARLREAMGSDKASETAAS